jgi:hypothetical protein
MVAGLMRALWRIFVIVAGYMCSLVGLFAAFALFFGLASLVPSAPAYWSLTGVSPVIFAGAPVVGLFAVTLALVLSAAPLMLLVVAAEIFSWRNPAVYAVPGALLAAAIYWQFSPRTIGGLDEIGFAEVALFALSGAAAGAVYWLVAGRKAGVWR